MLQTALNNVAAWVIPATAILLFFDKLGPGFKGMKRLWLRNKQDAFWERVLRAVTWVEDHPNNITWELSKWGWDPWFNEAERIGYIHHRKHGGGEYVYERDEKKILRWGKQLDEAIEECDPALCTLEVRYFALRPRAKDVYYLNTAGNWKLTGAGP